MKTPQFMRVLGILLALSSLISTSAFAQRTWHLEGDSVGTADFIGTTNSEDLTIKTDSTTRITVRSGDVVIEGNIIDSTGSLRIDSIRARVIHVGDSSLVIGGTATGTVGTATNFIMANDGGATGAGNITLGHTSAGGGGGTNFWNANVGIGTRLPQTKLQLNTNGANDCFALFTNSYNGWAGGLGFPPEGANGFRVGLAANDEGEIQNMLPQHINFLISNTRHMVMRGNDYTASTPNVNNTGWVGIGTVGTPMSRLHVGEDHSTLPGNLGGWRSWMRDGLYANTSSDYGYFGMKMNEDINSANTQDLIIS